MKHVYLPESSLNWLKSKSDSKVCTEQLPSSWADLLFQGKAKAGGTPGEDETQSPGAVLAVLRECRIFVDVRTDDGDDAGGLFVDMLRGMGAKVCLPRADQGRVLTCCLCRSRTASGRDARMSCSRMG